MVNRILDLLVQYKAVEFGDFTLASGAQSRYYIDVKTAIMQPKLLQEIAAEVAASFEFECIAGVAVGGVPLAVAVSLAADKPCAVIRAAAKDHGKNEMIIGNVKGKRVILIEDVTTSGGSSKYGVDELRKAGALIDTVITVVDREGGAEKLLAADGVTLHALVKASELLA
ncbi:orotate phosphoribosyltransferase [Methanocorpusculum bavaricum]|uniref:orotate phosphoribosyltransferase n=1 Tax=Methanocorpusculum bavaricum TaxID=71518 RepID=UPI0005B2EA8E|nr:orotate phosphoribosyltransferase [Methanocorpusculum bavaricum]